MRASAYVITGYLGSGKTTFLINSARKYLKDRKVAIVVNEIGDISVDGQLLKRHYAEVLELPDGCVCCALSEEFERVVENLIQNQNPDVILVETSGSAIPMPVMYSLQALNCALDGVICIIDAFNFDKIKFEQNARSQIGSSNILVLNKIDLISSDELKRIEKELLGLWRESVPKNTITGEPLYERVLIFSSQNAIVNGEIFECSYTLKELENYNKQHSHSQSSNTIYFFENIDLETLQRKLSEATNIIRAKGIVRLKNYPFPTAVQWVFGKLEIYDDLPDYSGPSFIVYVRQDSCMSI
ncbi:MAG: GTP-binding protein [Aquificaceae bacterium]|nr:GTP-binding protein [Aquificaceae bacterium]MDW8236983.1 GTP-binding protein [Aquificaceae bacterium]